MDKKVKFTVEIESNGEKILKNISVNAGELQQALDGISPKAQQASESLNELAAFSIALNSSIEIIERLRAQLGALAETYNSFDKGMRAVNTMAGKNAEELAALKSEVEGLAEFIPLAKEQLSGGLYQVISNGVPEDNWISFLEKSSKAAVGGIADLGQTVTVTSTIIKNYGLEWDAAGEIQDKMQTTAKNGVTSFEQLAQALPRVSGNAAALGVELDELLGIFATLTGVSGNTAEVSTQVAAVFTALVKPSSEAAEMADSMGIRFDAAAIKAAGGMQQFLVSLDESVRRYAAATGMLEQEVYGKLFGSAEALRALTPLTGNLADKFQQNVTAMASSAGTIDAAFEDMAGSGEAVNQILMNQLTTMTDWIGSMASSAMPMITFVALSGQAASGVILFGKAATAAGAALKGYGVVTMATAVHERIATIARNMLTMATGSATVGTVALTAATVALYAAMTMGLSVIITGLVALFSSLGDEAEETGEKIDNMKEATDAMAAASSAAQSAIELEKNKLRELIRAHGDETTAVAELNKKYGDLFGNHKTAADWYDVLTKKSKAYSQQLGYEAMAKTLAAKKAEAEMKMLEMRSAGKVYFFKKMDHGKAVDVAFGEKADEYTALMTQVAEYEQQFNVAVRKMNEAQKELQQTTTQSVSWQQMSYERLGDAIEKQKRKVASLAGVKDAEAKKEAAELAKMQARYKSLGEKFGLSGNTQSKKEKKVGEKLIKNAESYADLGNNIQYYQKKLEKLAPTQTAELKRLTRLIAALKEKQAAVKADMDAAAQPAELDTLEKIELAIEYQRNLRKKASRESLAQYDAEISRLEAARTAFEDHSKWSLPIEQIKTYKELSEQIALYENRLKIAGESERSTLSRHLRDLKRIQGEWDYALDVIARPRDIRQLNTLEELSEAVDYYAMRQKRATNAEMVEHARAMAAIERKRDALERLTEIPKMENELSDLSALSGKKLNVELKLIGTEGIKTKIRELQKMLDDTRHPLGQEQRAEVEQLLASWRSYENILKRSELSFKDAWGNVRQLTGGVQDLTQALEGDGNAWEKITKIVDGFIAIYEGITKVVGIIQILTGVSRTHAAAKGAEAAAETAAAGARAGATAAAATSSGAMIVINEAEMAVWKELAAAKYMAAHAAIPFAGFGIGAGFTASMLATTAAAGIPKFADGGIAYGTTLGIFGEYAGAANNPEVVAPLDKLRSLLNLDDGGKVGKVVFRISGRELVGVLNSELHRTKRNT